MISLKILSFRDFSTKERFFLYITFFYIVVNIFPLFTDIIHVPTFVPALFVSLLLGIAYFNILFSKPMKWFIAYVFILVFYNLIGLKFHINGLSTDLPGFYKIIIETAWILPSLMISIILQKSNNFRLYKYIGNGAIILLISSFIYVLPMIMANANYLRMDFDASGITRPLGMPGYTLMHAYALLFPALCYWSKISKGIKKFIALGITALFAYLIIRTSITTSLFVISFCIIVTMAYNPYYQTKSLFRFGVIGLLMLLFYYSGMLQNIIEELMPFFEDTAVSEKLTDIRDSLIQGEVTGGTLTVRDNLHQESINNFFSNPIIGMGYAGRHSKILDILGSSGLLVFVPFIMMIWTFTKEKAHWCSDKYYKFFIYFSIFISFIYLYQKGIFGAEGWLFTFVITPCVITSVYLNSKSIYKRNTSYYENTTYHSRRVE